MSILKSQTYPTNLGTPPSNLVTFESEHNTDRIDWIHKAQSVAKSSFTPGYGDTATFTDGGSPYGNGGMQEATGLFQDDGNKGFKVQLTNGNSHEGNIEIKNNDSARWMPASIFNGCAFQLHQNSSSSHAMWVDRYALSFIHKTNNTWRIIGNTPNDGYNNAPHAGYRYVDFNYEPYINQVRGLGSDYLFFSIIVHIRNNGGAGSDNSAVKLWDLKMYHKCVGSVSSKHRIFAPKIRTLSNRNNSTFGLSFS